MWGDYWCLYLLVPPKGTFLGLCHSTIYGLQGCSTSLLRSMERLIKANRPSLLEMKVWQWCAESNETHWWFEQKVMWMQYFSTEAYGINLLLVVCLRNWQWIHLISEQWLELTRIFIIISNNFSTIPVSLILCSPWCLVQGPDAPVSCAKLTCNFGAICVEEKSQVYCECPSPDCLEGNQTKVSATDLTYMLWTGVILNVCPPPLLQLILKSGARSVLAGI